MEQLDQLHVGSLTLPAAQLVRRLLDWVQRKPQQDVGRDANPEELENNLDRTMNLRLSAQDPSSIPHASGLLARRSSRDLCSSPAGTPSVIVCDAALSPAADASGSRY